MTIAVPRFVYNTCSKCNEKIRVQAPGDRFARKMLTDTDSAVCKNCEEISGWRRYGRIDQYK